MSSLLTSQSPHNTARLPDGPVRQAFRSSRRYGLRFRQVWPLRATIAATSGHALLGNNVTAVIAESRWAGAHNLLAANKNEWWDKEGKVRDKTISN